MPTIARRTFLAAGSVGLIGGAVAGRAEGTTRAARGFDGKEDPIDRVPAETVAEFVGVCHFNVERVGAMLAVEPGLAKSAWDWGFGDWETGIGAASHTGRVEIVEMLMAHGARPDVFTLAMLDRVDAVRDVLENIPAMGSIEGPHSISLYRHAQAGRAERVKEYLASIGLDDTTNPFQTDKTLGDTLGGAYSIAPNDADGRPGASIIVAWSERFACLTLTPPGGTSRNLMPIEPGVRSAPGERAFRPAGSRGARIVFPDERSLRVEYNGTVTAAVRVVD